MKTIWDLLDGLNFGSIHICYCIFTCAHMFGSVVYPFQQCLTRKITITQSVACSIYELQHQQSFYFIPISKPHTLSILVSYSQSNSQKIKFQTKKNFFNVINHCENKANSGAMSQQGNTVHQLWIRPFKRKYSLLSTKQKPPMPEY